MLHRKPCPADQNGSEVSIYVKVEKYLWVTRTLSLPITGLTLGLGQGLTFNSLPTGLSFGSHFLALSRLACSYILGKGRCIISNTLVNVAFYSERIWGGGVILTEIAILQTLLCTHKYYDKSLKRDQDNHWSKNELFPSLTSGIFLK